MATMKDFLRSSIMAGGSVAAAPSGQTVSISAKSSVGDWAEISLYRQTMAMCRLRASARS